MGLMIRWEQNKTGKTPIGEQTLKCPQTKGALDILVYGEFAETVSRVCFVINI